MSVSGISPAKASTSAPEVGAPLANVASLLSVPRRRLLAAVGARPSAVPHQDLLATVRSIRSRAADGSQAEHSRAARLLLFEQGEESLRRGVCIHQVMAGCGQLFAQASGSSSTFAMSEESEFIDTFLSHNWVVGRWRKYLALSFHFNLGIAVTCTCCVLVFLYGCGAAGLLPVFPCVRLNTEQSYFPLIFAVPSFFCFLFLAGEAPARLGRRGPMVFLDKVCIHQTDAGLQRQGIQKLGAFLSISEQMVILYSNIYLFKLWTVYEMASFLSFRGVDKMIFLPCFQALFFAIALLSVWIGSICVAFSVTYTDHPLAQVFFSFGGSLVFGIASRRWARRQDKMIRCLQTFTVRRCLVHVEADRPLLYENIAAIVKLAGCSSADASTEEALDAFDAAVRSEMPKAFRQMSGGLGLRYEQILTLSGLMSYTWFFDYVDFPLRKRLSFFLSMTLLTFAMYPLALITCDRMGRQLLHLSGAKEALWLAFVAASGSLMVAFNMAVGIYFLDTAASSDAAMFTLLVLLAVGPLAALRLARCYRGGPVGDATSRCRPSLLSKGEPVSMPLALPLQEAEHDEDAAERSVVYSFEHEGGS